MSSVSRTTLLESRIPTDMLSPGCVACLRGCTPQGSGEAPGGDCWGSGGSFRGGRASEDRARPRAGWTRGGRASDGGLTGLFEDLCACFGRGGDFVGLRRQVYSVVARDTPPSPDSFPEEGGETLAKVTTLRVDGGEKHPNPISSSEELEDMIPPPA